MRAGLHFIGRLALLNTAADAGLQVHSTDQLSSKCFLLDTDFDPANFSPFFSSVDISLI